MDAAGRGGDHPFTKLKVRRAVAHAIDREAIAKNLVGGVSKVVHAPCYPSQVGCTQDVPKYEYDPEKAKALLAEAGYHDGFETHLYAYRDRQRSEESRVGKECVSKCRSRWCASHEKKKKKK